MPRPDEGLIHAWLDGQLSTEEAARVEQLVATDTEWAAAAAEARGVIAAASRILLSLDHAPSGVVPRPSVTPTVRRLPWWTKVAAALVLVAGTGTIVMRRSPQPDLAQAPRTADTVGAARPLVLPPGTPAVPPAPVARTAKTPSKAASKSAMSALAERSSGVEATATTGMTPPTVPAAALVGGVSDQQEKLAAVADQAPRAQSLDQQRQGAGQVSAQRTSMEMQREMNMVSPVREPARDQASPSIAALRTDLMAGGCYELRDSRTSAVAGAVMRGDRMQGDTLYLVPARTPSAARAWVVSAGGAARGVLTQEPDGRGMVLVSARPAACPAP